jgi:hypothetical protein
VAGDIDADELQKTLGDVSAEEYEYIIGAMAGQLEAGDISQNDFQRTVEIVIAVAILLAFLRASGKDEDELSAEERALIDDNVRIGQEAAGNLADDIVAGRYTATEEKPKPPSLLERAALWAAAIIGIQAIGQMYQTNDPFLVWRVGPTEHCADCLRLNGQIHRGSEWLASGWSPQSPSLQCHGYHCQCRLEPADGPSRGGF